MLRRGPTMAGGRSLVKRLLVVRLVSCLASPLPCAVADTQGTAAQGSVSEARTFKVKATLVSIDLAAQRLTYVDGASGAAASAVLGSGAAAQAVKLKSGQRVTLHCRVIPPSTTPVVESIKTPSRKKLLILGLVVVAVALFFATVASEPPL
jgi:hypothetical protein